MSNASLKELIAQRDELEKKIQEQQAAEKSEAVQKVRALIADHGLSQEDVFPVGRAKNANAGAKVAPKYVDPVSGQTWTGRGKPPKWIADVADRTPFEIKN